MGRFGFICVPSASRGHAVERAADPLHRAWINAKTRLAIPRTPSPVRLRSFYLNTKDGPLVLEIPPAVLGPLDDAWFRWVTDVGVTGPDKGAGGKYLLLPPGYTGEVPDGYFVARSRTFGNLLFFRTFLKDGDPKPGVIVSNRTYACIRSVKPQTHPR